MQIIISETHIAAGKAYTFSSARAYIFKPECQTVSGIKNILLEKRLDRHRPNCKYVQVIGENLQIKTLKHKQSH